MRLIVNDRNRSELIGPVAIEEERLRFISENWMPTRFIWRMGRLSFPGASRTGFAERAEPDR